MTPVREAIVVPAIFLTVALLGGLRVAETVSLLPPSLTALVLAVLLLGTLVRGGVLVPQALMNGARTGLENTSGAIVLLTAFAASAQAMNLLLPERGLLHAAFAIFLFCQIMTMNAGAGGRDGLLRSLLVLLGSLFILRYIVIEALYAPAGGLLQRVLTTLMSGATLGGIAYDPNASVTGYVAFFTLFLFVIGIICLPPASTAALVKRPPSQSSGLPSALAIIVVLVSLGCRPTPQAAETERLPSDAATREAHAASRGARLVSAAQRRAALQRAQVWLPPQTPIARAKLNINPAGPDAFSEADEVDCRLVVKAMHGTTPKFDCERQSGDVIRVKYGRGNPELHAEVVTTRLLAALGFGADRMYFVKRIRCAGCSAFPFHSLACLAETGLERGCFPRGIDYSRPTDFEFAVIERRLDARPIESSADEGWAWFELDRVDARAGGAARAHVDGLKLLAALIAHWDNKAANQRLVCLPGGDAPDGGCTRPLAMMQDLGASFGPMKLDLHNWRSFPVWADPRACRVSMEKLPWGGGTFPEQQISEEGRQFLLKLLEQLSVQQIEDLFRGARIEWAETITADGRQPAAWAAAFQDKVRQIREAGPCGQ
jgi:hypothetical protein